MSDWCCFIIVYSFLSFFFLFLIYIFSRFLFFFFPYFFPCSIYSPFYLLFVVSCIFLTIFNFFIFKGGSAWNFVKQNDTQLSIAYTHIARRLQSRGINACTCQTCTETKGCAGNYQEQSYNIPTVQGGMGFAIGLFSALLVLIIVSLFYKGPTHQSGYTRVN